MKKKLLLLTLSMVVPIAAWCEDGDVFTAKTVENIEMTFKVISEADKTCQVGKGLGATVEPSISTEIVGHVTIPSEVNGYAVTTLAVNAFAGCTNLSSISVPNSVTAIGSSAFQNTQWYNDQPDGLVYAGKVAYAYKGIMPSETTIEIKDGTKGIAASCFRNYSSLVSVDIPEGVLNIGENAFGSCTNLATISIPSSVISIGNAAFANTSWYNNQPKGLVYAGTIAYKYKGSATAGTIVEIQEGTTGIVDNAFSGCSNIVSISIPNTVLSIGMQAFYQCSDLTTVTLSRNLSSLGWYTFGRCKKLESITIPANLKKIDETAFRYCSGLTAISVDEKNPFYDSRNNCNALIEKSTNTLILGCMNTLIPNSIESIADCAFDGCAGLVSISIPGSVLKIGANAFYDCSGLKSVTLFNGVKQLCPCAFADCTALESITIPSSVTDIGYNAFSGSTALKTVIIYAPSLNTYESSVFLQTDYDHKIYVLADKVTNYKSNWSENSNRIYPITLTANDAGTSGKWCTYYNEGCDVTVADGTVIYKATLNGAKTQVTLTKIDGNIIKAGEAVVLNTTSANIELSSAASSGSGDYSDNDLKGGSTVADGTTAYTLGMIGGQLGFYQYSGTALLDPYKAHLEIPATSASPLISISGTTGIDNIEKEVTGKESKWYDLSGRELQGKPMQKGIYLKYGKKYIVK